MAFPNITNTYVLPTAGTSNLGGIKAGTNTLIATDGTLSVTSVPFITVSGATTVGSVITSTLASGISVLGYQWMRNGVVIAGATTSTYTTVSADAGYAITCTISGIGFTSTSIGIAVIAPLFTSAPSISGTYTAVNSISSYVAGTYSGSISSITQQWMLDTTSISGATNSTYTPVSTDQGHTLYVVETATNASGAAISQSSGIVISAAIQPIRFASAFGRVAGLGASQMGYPVLSITSSGTTATVQLSTTMALTTGQTVIIYRSDYSTSPYSSYSNLAITVVDSTHFTYQFTGSAGAVDTTGLLVVEATFSQVFAQNSNGSVAITTSGTTATATLYGTAEKTVGDTVLILGCSGVSAALNGAQVITGIPTSTTITFTCANISNASSTGTAIVYSTTQTGFCSEIQFTLGSGSYSELEILVQNWWLANLGNSSVNAGVYNGLATWYIDDASIVIGSSYAPVKFSGLRTATITPGMVSLVSDAVLPSQFIGGIPTLARGTNGFMKIRGHTSSAKDIIPAEHSHSATTFIQALNYSTFRYNQSKTSVCTVSATDSSTQYSVSGSGANGTDFSTIGASVHAVLMGRMTASAHVFLGQGDSIMDGVGDSISIDNNTGAASTNASAGRPAWLLRSMWDVNFSQSSAIACLNTGISGSDARIISTGFQGATASTFYSLYQYCTHLVDEFGTNPGGTNAMLQASWAAAQSVGAKVIRTSLFARSGSSSYNFITNTATSTDFQGNGLPTSGWGVASAKDTLEQGYKSSAGTSGGPDYYLPLTSGRRNGATDHTTTDYWQFVTDGTTNQYGTADGLHPSAQGHRLIANDARAFWATLP